MQSVLRQLQSIVGGIIVDDDDRVCVVERNSGVHSRDTGLLAVSQ